MNDDEIREELQDHVDRRAAWNEAEGMPPDRAARDARLRFGNLTRAYENTRRVHVSAFLESAWQDTRHALRSFARAPGLTAAAIVAIALGIGACTAVFSVIDRILFRALPYAAEDRLVWLGVTATIDPTEFVLGADYLDWRELQTPFESIASTTGGADCDLTDGEPLRAACMRVEATLLPTLGVQPLLGRNFTAAEDRPGAPRVALLSWPLWQTRFGGDPGVLGRTVILDGAPAAIIGVLPRGFEMPNLGRADLLVPQALNEAEERKRVRISMLRVYARLKPGVTLQQAKEQLRPLFEHSLQFVPPQFRKEVRLSVSSMRERQVRDARLASWVLLAAVGCVLLIACANVANMLLARSISRQREQAIRAAIGASRWRLARQTLTESVLLCALGGVAGMVLAHALLRLLVKTAPGGIPRLAEAAIDVRVLAFGAVAIAVSALAVALAPMFHSTGVDRLNSPRVAGSGSGRVRHLLIAAQLAVSVVLLTSAGLLLRTLWNMQHVPLGFEADRVLAAHIGLSRHRFPDPSRQAAFFTALEERVRRYPGIGAVAVSDTLPPLGRVQAMIYSRIQVEGRDPLTEGGTGGMVPHRYVTPGYFDAMRIPLVQGRTFAAQDAKSVDSGIIVSQRLARMLFPAGEPLGKRLRPGLDGEWLTIIGVAADVKNSGLTATTEPEYYEMVKPGARASFRRASLVVRATSSRQAASAIRAEAAQLDPTLPIEFETLTQRVTRVAERPRFNGFLLALFAAIGLFLSGVGLFGVVSFAVAQRTREIGVRIALGATAGQVRSLVLRASARWILAGAITGAVGALIASNYLRSMLFGVQAHDPATLAAVLLLLGIVTVAAAWLPARRAARLDPAITLRHD